MFSLGGAFLFRKYLREVKEKRSLNACNVLSCSGCPRLRARRRR